MGWELESLIVNICSNVCIGTKYFIRKMKKTNIRKIYVSVSKNCYFNNSFLLLIKIIKCYFLV